MKKIILLMIFVVLVLFTLSCSEKTAKTYSVTFDGFKTIVVSENSLVPRPQDPKKDGDEYFYYMFDGWYYQDVRWDFDNNRVDKNINLVPKFNKFKMFYTLSFEDDGKNYCDSIKYEYNDIIDDLPLLEKIGYKFEGWFLDNKLFDYERMPALNITLKAKWSIVTYYATFMADGKQVGEPIPFTVLTKREEFDELLPNVPEKKGSISVEYTNGRWEQFELVPNNITINAIYTKVEWPRY